MINLDIGSKIKNLRVQQELTQEELADRSELTKGFISQLERNLTSPSVATLIDILEALGTTPKEFFSSEKQEEKIVFTKEDQFIGEKDDYLINWVIPNAQKNLMEPVVLELEKSAQTKTTPPFEGEVFGYVLKGRMKLIFGDQIYRIKQGDSFYFQADSEFYLKNGESAAKVMLISSPPHF